VTNDARSPSGDVGVLEAANKSMGQVIFLGSPASGGVIFASLALGDPKLAAYAALGTITANTTSKIIGLDKETWNNGLWGYNGALIGCAASVFGPAYYPYTVLSTLIGAAATPLVSASLKSVLSQPQWTWSFNIVALTSLLRTRPLLPSTIDYDVSTSTAGFEDAQKLFETFDTSVKAMTSGMDPVALSPLTGISQIFVVNSPLTGAGIVAATAMYSPMLALHAVGGCATGSLVGYLLGADLSAISDGLWGYNSCLASMAVGVFFVNSPHAVVLSATSAAAAAALFGAMGPLFGACGAPCLTLPFCTVATASYLLEGHIPGLKLAKNPHSPEKNELE
jgi:urea transporter